jgi:OFA family oxalate/formate antiporter-like MFS transporter
MMGLTLPALTFALAIDRILNGVTRPFFGWVSDHIGRENTMFICFALEAVGIVLMWEFGHDPIAFTLLTGLVFFAWGEIYSLFPATCADTFGSKFAATNAGLLYTAKGTASFLVPVASIMYEASGSWEGVFYAAAAVNALAAIVALFVLKPMRARTIREAKANTVQTGVIQPAE